MDEQSEQLKHSVDRTLAKSRLEQLRREFDTAKRLANPTREAKIAALELRFAAGETTDGLVRDVFAIPLVPFTSED